MGSVDSPASFRPLDRRVLPGVLVPAATALPAGAALGPLGAAMQCAPTLRAALQYAADHIHAYNSALRLCFEKLPDDGRVFLLVEADAGNAAQQRQLVEQTLATLRQVIGGLVGAPLRSLEVWLGHDAQPAPPAYRTHFDAPVRCGQSMSGLLLDAQDFELPLPGRDARRHDAAARLVAQRFPARPRRLATRVRIIVTHLLAEGGCSHDRAAAALNLHPRTLQRRLRDEGESFEAIKDQVRREVALRHLGQSNVSLVRMTEILGYSETSVLTRSCQRWFSASPRQLRQRQRRGAAEATHGAIS